MTDVTLFSEAVDQLQPGASGSDIAALLDHKIERTLACHWKAGRRSAPRWALQLLATKIRDRVAKPLRIADACETAPERLGKRAGAKNLAKYLARRS